MISADSLTCRVTPDSVEPNSLSCSVPPLEYLNLWTTVGSVATAIATIALVVAAIWAGRIAIQTLRQMKVDSIARTRPYLFASLAPSLSGAGRFDLLIENTGASAARHVRVKCPAFPSQPDDVALKLKRFLDAEHTIPPGARLRNYWRLTLREGHTWGDGTTDPAGMPEKATIVLNYLGDEGRKYEDHYVLDVVTLLFAPVAETGPNVRDDLSPGQKDLHKMLGVLATAIGELRR